MYPLQSLLPQHTFIYVSKLTEIVNKSLHTAAQCRQFIKTNILVHDSEVSICRVKVVFTSWGLNCVHLQFFEILPGFPPQIMVNRICIPLHGEVYCISEIDLFSRIHFVFCSMLFLDKKDINLLFISFSKICGKIHKSKRLKAELVLCVSN